MLHHIPQAAYLAAAITAKAPAATSGWMYFLGGMVVGMLVVFFIGHRK